MNKKIFIINGMGGSGKDTFVNIIAKKVPTKHISIVNKVKEAATLLGWQGGKDENDRKFLSDLKILSDKYNDGNYKYIIDEINKFKEDKVNEVLCIDMREKPDIEKLRIALGKEVKIVLVYRKNVDFISSNIADANVFTCSYDIFINNSGTIGELEALADNFIETHIKEPKKPIREAKEDINESKSNSINKSDKKKAEKEEKVERTKKDYKNMTLGELSEELFKNSNIESFLELFDLLMRL